MNRRIDLSIWQRLALGFGVAGALLALLVVTSHRWSERIEAMQRRQDELVRPRATAAARLETAALYAALAAREYAITPDAAHLQAYEADAQKVRDALAALPRDEDGEALFNRIPVLVDRFQDASRQMVDARQGSMPGPVLESTMGGAREDLLAVVRAYEVLQHRKMDGALAEIAGSARDMDRAGLALAALVAGLLAATFWLTARSVRRPALALVAASRRLAAGDFDQAVALAGAPAMAGEASARDELSELARSFGRMALNLREREARLRAGAQLAGTLATGLDAGRLCEAVLEALLGHLGAEAGAIYLVEEGGRLRRRAALGLPGSGEDALEAGEGIPGRAVQTRRTVTVNDLPAGSPFGIHMGVDRLPPRAVAAAPLLLQDQKVAGALVAASVRPLSPEAIQFLEQAALLLASSLQNAFGHARIQQQAEQLQEQNERLQAQQEEVQSQAEEIQAQNEELQSQNEELQAQGEELQSQGLELRRTVDRLSASEEALREADRNKNEFLAVLSHELRNPLAAIRNSLYILERIEPGSQRAKRVQSVIDRQVELLARLVEDVLDLTRISRGKINLQTAPVDLGAVVKQAAEDHGAEFSSRGIHLAVQSASDAYVDGDPARLAQVTGNLLVNAAKFTSPGGRVSVSVSVDGGKVRLRVEDTGSGMDAQTLGRLFEPFMQANMTLARTNGGLGLGLALVKRLVEMHGGSVRAHSDGPGMGSEFTVELPVRDPPPTGEPRPPPPRPRTRRRVLVVEDNVDAAESLAEALALGGHEVVVAFRGGEGIEKARAWRPDVLVCDIGLPDMEGHEVARAIRGDPALNSVFLVALSGYALPDDVRKASEAGFDEHLAKPPNLARLKDLLAAAG
jgi:signal transduction histidine kinase/HAMP domain-containing protein